MPSGEGPVTFAQFCDTWLATWAIVRLKESGYREYSSIVKLHLIPEFGELQLPAITAERIQRWVAAEFTSGISSRTLRNRVIVLNRVMQTACEYGLIEANPVDAVVLPRIEDRELAYLSPEQVRLLLDATPPAWTLLLGLAALGGLRKGEILAAEWSDLSDDPLAISVTKSVRNGRVSSTKTHASSAKVVLPESLRPLIAQRRRQADGHKLVFSKADGSYLSDTTPNRVLQRSLERTGLPHIRFHDLRASWAVGHMLAGTDLKTLAHLGRWSSPSTLVDAYARVIGTGGDAVRRFDEFYGQ